MIAVRVWNGAVLTAGGELFRVDALSALMIVIVTFLGAIAALYAIGYIRAELNDAPLSRARLFFALFHLFIFTMLVAVTTDNLGIMWIAIEGTTLATVFLVNLRHTRTSLEAAYKYLILSSVGIALAFIGTALLYYAGAATAGEIAVNWSALNAAAGSLNGEVVRLAFVFILIGYGTKAGLAPMHTWLPDAHSEAPAPISALMSGVLLNVGLYAMIRFKTVVDAAVGSAICRAFVDRHRFAFPCWSLRLSWLGSEIISACSPTRASNTSASSASVWASAATGESSARFSIVVNHALSKSLLFILSGNILLKYHSAEISDVRGLLRAAPCTGALFLAGTFALIGLPPFAPFISEFIIFPRRPGE